MVTNAREQSTVTDSDSKGSSDQMRTASSTEPKSIWTIAENLTKIFAGVLIPLVAAWVGWSIHVSGTNTEYLKQAVAELSKNDTNPALRGWAVDVFLKTSPVPVTQELEQALRKGSVSLRQTAAGLGPETNQAGRDLSGRDLSGLDLSRANLRRANLTKTNLSGTNMSEAILADASLTEAKLVGADLRDAVLEFSDLRGAIMTNANLRHARLGGSDLRGVDLSRVLGLEMEQLVTHVLAVDPTQYGGGRLDAKPIAQWDKDTKFPETIRNELTNLQLVAGK